MLDQLDYGTAYWLDYYEARARKNGYIVEYEPFIYPADFLPIAAAGTDEKPVTIDQYADFILTHQTLAVINNATGTAVTQPNFLARLIGESSGRQFQSDQVHVMNVFGTGQRPFILSVPPIFNASTTFSVELENIDAANAYRVHLAFIGVHAKQKRAG